MQRNFEPMQGQVEAWRRFERTDVTAMVVCYEAFVGSRLEVSKRLAPTVHNLYFEPRYEEFPPRPCGVGRMFSHLPCRNLIRSPKLRRQRSWENSWRLDSHSRSEITSVPAGRRYL